MSKRSPTHSILIWQGSVSICRAVVAIIIAAALILGGATAASADNCSSQSDCGAVPGNATAAAGLGAAVTAAAVLASVVAVRRRPKARDCDGLLANLQAAQNRYRALDQAIIQAEQAQAKTKLPASSNELAKAQEELRQARQRLDNVNLNPNVPDPATWQGLKAGAEARIARAEQRLYTARAAVDNPPASDQAALQVALNALQQAAEQLNKSLAAAGAGDEGTAFPGEGAPGLDQTRARLRDLLAKGRARRSFLRDDMNRKARLYQTCVGQGAGAAAPPAGAAAPAAAGGGSSGATPAAGSAGPSGGEAQPAGKGGSGSGRPGGAAGGGGGTGGGPKVSTVGNIHFVFNKPEFSYVVVNGQYAGTFRFGWQVTGAPNLHVSVQVRSETYDWSPVPGLQNRAPDGLAAWSYSPPPGTRLEFRLVTTDEQGNVVASEAQPFP
ncbi:MAG: HlyD family secretion protein [Dehalococcoidia bacterium]